MCTRKTCTLLSPLYPAQCQALGKYPLKTYHVNPSIPHPKPGVSGLIVPEEGTGKYALDSTLLPSGGSGPDTTTGRTSDVHHCTPGWGHLGGEKANMGPWEVPIRKSPWRRKVLEQGELQRAEAHP